MLAQNFVSNTKHFDQNAVVFFGVNKEELSIVVETFKSKFGTSVESEVSKLLCRTMILNCLCTPLHDPS